MIHHPSHHYPQLTDIYHLPILLPLEATLLKKTTIALRLPTCNHFYPIPPKFSRVAVKLGVPVDLGLDLDPDLESNLTIGYVQVVRSALRAKGVSVMGVLEAGGTQQWSRYLHLVEVNPVFTPSGQADKNLNRVYGQTRKVLWCQNPPRTDLPAILLLVLVPVLVPIPMQPPVLPLELR